METEIMSESSIAAQSFFVAIEDSIKPGDRIIVVNNVVVAVQRDAVSTPRVTDQRTSMSIGANGNPLPNAHWGSRELAYGTAETATLRLDMLRAVAARPGFHVASYLDTELRIPPATHQRIAVRTMVVQMKNQGLLTHHKDDKGRARQRLLITPKGRALMEELDKQP